MGRLKESDLFFPLKSYFENERYTVYAEVPCYGRTADIVAVRDNIVTVVEMKVTMNLKLVEQVFFWRNMANYVYAAVPMGADITPFVRELLRNAGIGIIGLDIRVCDDSQPFCSRIEKYEKAKLFRKLGYRYMIGREEHFQPIRWEQHIIPEHSQNVAGVQHADIRVSRYKLMMDRARHLLSIWPEGMSINKLADELDTYYANPKTGLYNALKNYESDWCEFFYKPGDRKTHVRLKVE